MLMIGLSMVRCTCGAPGGAHADPDRGFDSDLREPTDGPDDRLVGRFHVLWVGSSAKRASAAIRADTPRNEQLISVPVCIGFPRL